MHEVGGRDSILCYGHDEVLLITRQKVLEAVGLPVEIASTADSYRERLLAGHVALILLCQSLPAEECRLAAAFAGDNSPSSKLLVMYMRPGNTLPYPDQAEFFCGDGPLALVSTVRRLLSHER